MTIRNYDQNTELFFRYLEEQNIFKLDDILKGTIDSFNIYVRENKGGEYNNK